MSAPTHDFKTKVRALVDVSNRLAEKFERPFVQNMVEACNKGWSISEKRINKVDELYKKHVEGGTSIQAPVPSNPIVYDKVRADISPQGWMIKVGDVPVGKPLVRNNADTVAKWLSEALPQITEKAIALDEHARMQQATEVGEEGESLGVRAVEGANFPDFDDDEPAF